MFCPAIYEAHVKMLLILSLFASIVWVKAEAVQHDEAVGFTSWTESIQTYSYPHVIKFEGVGVNEGSHFNATTHMFTCPYDGVYYVAFSSKRYGAAYNDIEVVINNVKFMNVMDVYANVNNTVSNSALRQCAKGENLYVIGRLGGTIYGEPGVADSTFTVFMVTQETTGDILSRRHDSVVGFSAYVYPDWEAMSYDAGEIIVFPNSIHYSPHYVNGLFTCPVTGVYYAAMHVHKFHYDNVHMGISKGNITQLHVEETSGGASVDVTLSNSGLMWCEVNETLSVRGTDAGWFEGSDMLFFTTFSAVLMYEPDESYHSSFVGFTVFKTSDQNYTSGETITYQRALLNEGRSFSRATSAFLCVSPGLYYVTVNFKRLGSQPLHIAVATETGVLFRVVEEYDGNAGNMVTNSGLFRCSGAGQQVRVVATGSGGVHGNLEKRLTTFTVMKIHE